MQTHWSQTSTSSVARACAEQASRPSSPHGQADPCYELFRRAFCCPVDQDAWAAILVQYQRLIGLWLGRWISEDAVQDVFFRFWRAQQGAKGAFTCRFPNIRTVMGYLKRCAFAERFERDRAKKRQQQLLDRLQDDARVLEVPLARSGPDPIEVHLRNMVRAKLKTDVERIVFELSYGYGLAPRDIYAMHAGLFSDVRAVCRVKENLIKRLRRDADIRAWLAVNPRSDAKDGGNPVKKTV